MEKRKGITPFNCPAAHTQVNIQMRCLNVNPSTTIEDIYSGKTCETCSENPEQRFSKTNLDEEEVEDYLKNARYFARAYLSGNVYVPFILKVFCIEEHIVKEQKKVSADLNVKHYVLLPSTKLTSHSFCSMSSQNPDELLFVEREIENVFHKGYVEQVALRFEENIFMANENHKLKTIWTMNLDPSIRNRIFVTLYEFELALNLKKDVIKDNKETLKKRRDTVKCLEKALDFTFLTKDLEESMLREIDRLNEYESSTKTYQPIDDLIYGTVIFYETSDDPIISFQRKLRENRKEDIDEKEDLLNTHLEVRDGPRKLFFEYALRCAVFMILHEEANKPKGEAKEFTIKILNEFYGWNLKSTDIDNARR